MTAKTRQTYTAELTREAIRLVLAHGGAMTEDDRSGAGAGNVNLRPKSTWWFQARGMCRLTETRAIACARTIGASAWSARC
jgi:hypothetical protein